MHGYPSNTAQLHLLHMRAFFSSYDYSQHTSRMFDWCRPCTYQLHSEQNYAKVLFSQLLFCRAWHLKVFISFHRFPDTFRQKSCIQVMRRLALVKLILEEGACSLTSWAIRIIGYCLNFNVAVVCNYKICPLAQGLVGVTELLAQDPKLLARQLSDMSTLHFKKG